MAKTSENSIAVYNFVKEHDGENITAADIAEATGLGLKTINGIVTSAFQKKELMERIPAEIKLEDGSHKAVKFIKLTETGRTWTPETE